MGGINYFLEEQLDTLLRLDQIMYETTSDEFKNKIKKSGKQLYFNPSNSNLKTS